MPDERRPRKAHTKRFFSSAESTLDQISSFESQGAISDESVPSQQYLVRFCAQATYPNSNTYSGPVLLAGKRRPGAMGVSRNVVDVSILNPLVTMKW